ncbi:hypothetical protein SAMN05518866_1676 [Sphingobium sp. YR768]|nr:hypothetical protein SAMN05518866_1676 [Sphingobium sp. YR768]
MGLVSWMRRKDKRHLADHSETELIQLFAQQTMHLLHKAHGIEPVFCETICTRAQAQADDAPLTFFWFSDDDAALIATVNGVKVRETLLGLMSEHDPLFSAVFDKIRTDLLFVIQQAGKAAATNQPGY